MSNTNPARGMRDFLPADIRKRNYVIGIIREVYEKYGFEPLETPTIENLSTLTNKYGEEGDQLMFKILKRGEKLEKKLEKGEIKNENELTDLALRYDLTVPLARVVANYKNDLPKFFKRYQIQPVWRADRPARGRYREFYQCDVDAIGSKSMLVEAELCLAINEILEKLGFKDFIIWINNRKLLTGILEGSNYKKDQINDILISLDKLDKIKKEGVIRELEQKKIPREQIEQSIKLIETIENKFREFQEIVENKYEEIRLQNNLTVEEIEVVRKKKELKEFESKTFNDVNFELLEQIKLSEKGNEGLKEIKSIFQIAEDLGLWRIRINPVLARGLSYYTGAIFEVVLTKGDFSGSIAGGGRYDGLIGMFGKEEIPAVGFSLGLERILLIMEERGMFPDDLTTNAADVLVTVWNEETAGESLKLANELRKKDLRVMVYPQADKLGKQFKYADQIDVEYVCILGDNELAENTVSLKNMKTGEQENVARDEVSNKIKA